VARAPIAAALTSAALLLGACGVAVGHPLDAQSAQRVIAGKLAGQFGTRPVVTCESGVPLTSGHTFSCTAVIDGQPLPVTGTVTGNQGEFSITLGAAVVNLNAAVHQLEAGIAHDTGTSAKVNCGPHRVLVVTPGHSFDCSATQPGGTRQVVVTVVDRNGDVRYRFEVPAAADQPAGQPPADERGAA
jgi:hypothetical protein